MIDGRFSPQKKSIIHKLEQGRRSMLVYELRYLVEAVVGIGVQGAKDLVSETGMARALEVAWGAAVDWGLALRKAVEVKQDNTRNRLELVSLGDFILNDPLSPQKRMLLILYCDLHHST